MFAQLISAFLDKMLFFALHLENSNAFPKPLSAKSELECFKAMGKGDEASKNKLIEHNLRLVAHIVKKYYTANYDQDDLISIGTIGLIKAVNTFDYTKTIKFATYASRCIENEILMYFRGMKKSSGDVYFDEPLEFDKDGNQLSLLDIVSNDDDLVEQIDLIIKSKQLYKIVERSLNEREREIIIKRYGLYGKKPKTQREVASELNISRSYVSRIEKKALQMMKKQYDRSENLK